MWKSLSLNNNKNTDLIAGRGGDPAHMIPGYAPGQRQSYLSEMRERKTAQREEGRKKHEEGGGLRKPRLRSQILSHSSFTASHVEVLERERGETRRAHEEEGEEEGKQQNDHGNIQNVSAWDSVRS